MSYLARSLRWVMIACSLLGCRVPEPPLQENAAAAVIYDPQTADALAQAFPQTPEQQALLERHHRAFEKPIALTAWEPDHSQWHVFFATNRRPTIDQRFGNDWGHDLSYGRCSIQLPKKRRGTEADGPPLSHRLTAWIPGRPATPHPESARVLWEHAQLHDDGEFFSQLQDVVSRAPEQDLFLFVHGFNVDFESCLIRAAQMGLSMPFNGAIVAYSWPSQGGVKNYGTDEGIVEDSIPAFTNFLTRLRQELPETDIHILVHSMGNRLVLNGLASLPESLAERHRLRNVILAAPDVGRSDFVTLAPAAVKHARHVTLYVNGSDTALIASKALHSEQRIGDALPPVVVAGVETIDASAIDTSFMGHSYYGSNRRVLSDIFSLVKEHRTAAQRPWLREEATADGSWWGFAALPTEVRWAWYFDTEDSAAAAIPQTSAADANPFAERESRSLRN